MNELDGAGQADMAVALVAAELGRAEQQHGPEPLSAGRDDMARELRDERDGTVHLLEDEGVDLGEVVRHEGLQSIEGWFWTAAAFVIQIDDDGQEFSPLRFPWLPQTRRLHLTGGLTWRSIEARRGDCKLPIPSPCGQEACVKELFRANDLVLISWAEALLRGEGIQTFVLDSNMSVLEGSANAIPRRLMVADDDLPAARRLIDAAREEMNMAADIRYDRQEDQG